VLSALAKRAGEGSMNILLVGEESAGASNPEVLATATTIWSA